MAFQEMSLPHPQSFLKWCLRSIPPILLALLVASCKPRPSHQESREIGFQGAARTQPFLAAERLLDSLGADSRKLTSLNDLPRGGTLIVNADSTSNQATGQRALEWAENEGGHLILFLSGSESWRDDWEISIGDLFSPPQNLDVHPVLKKYQLAVTKKDLESKSTATNVSVDIDGESYEMAPYGNFTIHSTSTSTKRRPDVLAGTRESSLLLSLPLQDGGRLTVINNAIPFRNRYLKDADHAKILVALIGLGTERQQYSVSFMLNNHVSFYGMLWEKFWMPLIALAILIVAWLWKNLPRFGPLLANPTNSDRQFADHLRMTGNFLWGRKRSADLLQAMRQSILRKLQARHHGISDGPEDRLLEHLATLTHIPYERVAAAWNIPFTQDSRFFLTLLRDLQSIHQSL